MKRTRLVVLGTLIAMCQFGCSANLGLVHDVFAQVMAIGWTADPFNLVP